MELTISGVDCLSSLIFVSPQKLFVTTKAAIGVNEGPVVLATKSGGRSTSSLTFRFKSTVDESAAAAPPAKGPSIVQKISAAVGATADERDNQIVSLNEQVTSLRLRVRGK